VADVGTHRAVKQNVWSPTSRSSYEKVGAVAPRRSAFLSSQRAWNSIENLLKLCSSVGCGERRWRWCPQQGRQVVGAGGKGKLWEEEEKISCGRNMHPALTPLGHTSGKSRKDSNRWKSRLHPATRKPFFLAQAHWCEDRSRRAESRRLSASNPQAQAEARECSSNS
jgi:hypothetical protein